MKLNSDTLDSNNNDKLLKSGTYHPSELLLSVRPEHRISWSDIKINETFANAAIIGHGSFGIVIKAHWNPHLINPDAEIKTDIPVAIKVMTKSLANGIQDVDLHSILKRACDEVTLVADAESKIGSSRNIIKMYGVAVGSLPNSLTELFRLQPNEEGVGIVMRYEEGGSLYSYLYENTKKNSFTMIEKLRVLCEIARGISDIHRVRVVHADLKPDNVLLSSKSSNAAIRLADFGLSTMKSMIADESFGDSTLALTARLKGTPIYCAPEMLINPFIDGANETQVAKPSRKTDMYAFALLAWEVLAETKPFLSIKSEAALCSKVHQGMRPDLNLLPPDTPMVIQDMITACWDKNRAVRKSAIECLAILECQYNMMRHAHVDIYLMSSPSYPYPGFLTQIYRILSEAGYVVQFDRHLHYTVDDTEVKQYVEISEDTRIMVILDKSFQNNTTCIDELTEIITTHPDNKIIPVCVEQKAALSTWMNEGLCKVLKDKMDSHPVFELSNFVTDSWEDDEEVCPDQLYDEFDQKMKPLLQMLRN
jgi:serine/threonine protein kinase